MSARTTTTTDHWRLEKFSRSRSVIPARTDGKGEHDIDWEHYTQSELHLTLKTVSTASPVLPLPASSIPRPTVTAPQVLLTVYYAPPNDHPTSPVDSSSDSHQSIILTTIDLTAFSSPDIVAHTPRDQLPIKVVHKGPVVAFRYLFVPGISLRSRQSTSNSTGEPEYRRFQMRLRTEGEMERFLQAIEVVCPIKPAAAPSNQAAKQDSKLQKAINSSALGARISQASHSRNSSSSAAVASTFRSPHSTIPSEAATFTLPALFPNIAASLRPPPALAPDRTVLKNSISHDYSALKLSRTPEDEFDYMLGEILMEEGFTDLVERVQERLKYNIRSG